MADETTSTTDDTTAVLDTPAGDAGTAGADLAPETQAAAPEQQRDADAAGDKRGPGPIPYERFKEVNGRLADYRRLGGDPDQIAQRLQRLDAIERASQGREFDPQHERRAVLRSTILDLINEEIPGFTQHARSLNDAHERELDRADHEAGQHLTRLLDTHGLPTSEESVATYATMVSAIIGRDEELHRQFQNPRTQARALDSAFSRVREHAINPALMSAGAQKLEQLAQRRAQLGTRAAPGSTAGVTGSEFNPKAKPGTPEYAAESERAIDAILAGGAG